MLLHPHLIVAVILKLLLFHIVNLNPVAEDLMKFFSTKKWGSDRNYCQQSGADEGLNAEISPSDGNFGQKLLAVTENIGNDNNLRQEQAKSFGVPKCSVNVGHQSLNEGSRPLHSHHFRKHEVPCPSSPFPLLSQFLLQSNQHLL